MSILFLFAHPDPSFKIPHSPFKIPMYPYHVPASAYIRRIMTRWTSRFAPALVVAFMALLILGIAVNAAFLIVALIFLFILAPTALMFVYYLYALKPRTVMLSAGDTAISVDGEKLTVDVQRPEASTFSFEIPVDEIREITPGNPYDIIIYGKNPDQFILIDKNAFPSQADRIQFHNYIYDKITKKSVNSHP